MLSEKYRPVVSYSRLIEKINVCGALEHIVKQALVEFITDDTLAIDPHISKSAIRHLRIKSNR